MVLLEIDAAGFAISQFESNAPGSVHVNRIALRIESLQRMKVEAGDVHFLGLNSDLETIKPCEIRLCTLASIFELLPLLQSSDRALLLKVLITSHNVSN